MQIWSAHNSHFPALKLVKEEIGHSQKKKWTDSLQFKLKTRKGEKVKTKRKSWKRSTRNVKLWWITSYIEEYIGQRDAKTTSSTALVRRAVEVEEEDEEEVSVLALLPLCFFVFFFQEREEKNNAENIYLIITITILFIEL